MRAKSIDYWYAAGF